MISTSRAINDSVATKLAARFYRAQGAGDSRQLAFSKASAMAESEADGDIRALWVETGKDNADAQSVDDVPWDIAYRQGADTAADWNLPHSVGDYLMPWCRSEARQKIVPRLFGAGEVDAEDEMRSALWVMLGSPQYSDYQSMRMVTKLPRKLEIHDNPDLALRPGVLPMLADIQEAESGAFGYGSQPPAQLHALEFDWGSGVATGNARQAEPWSPLVQEPEINADAMMPAPIEPPGYDGTAADPFD